MHHTGDNIGNPFVAKVITISVAAAQSDAPLDVSRNFSTATVKMVDKGQINETYCFMIFSCFTQFFSEFEVSSYLEVDLYTIERRHVNCRP
jgi:hypothetical protein